MKKLVKESVSFTLNPEIMEYIREVQNDLFTQSRSRVLEVMILDWLLEYSYIDDKEYMRLKRGESYVGE